MSKRSQRKPVTAIRQPLGSIDEVLAKHPGDWKACVGELRIVEQALIERGNVAAQTVNLCREQLMKLQAQIALLERLPAS